MKTTTLSPVRARKEIDPLSPYVSMVGRLMAGGYEKWSACEAVASAYGLDRAQFKRLKLIVGEARAA